MTKLLQAVIKSANQISRQVRFSSTQSLQFLNITQKDGYSILEMEKRPVNSLSLEMCEEVIKSLDLLEKEKSTKGLIITSKLPVFCAGLDIMEMYQPKQERLASFWKAVQEMTFRLHSSPLAMISAINGACPAGGCIFAFSSDYRIIANGKHRIGLNEVHLGIAAPFFLCDGLKELVGHRRAEEMLCLGSMYSPEEAVNIGMVDKITTNGDLIGDAEAHLKNYLQLPQLGRIKSKALIRRNFLNEFQAKRQEDLEMFLEFVPSEPVQKTLQNYLAMLKKK